MEQIPPARRRVLVVDDSDLVRSFVARVIQNELPFGCDVDMAADGREALEQLQAHRYDLLITDLDVPGASGLEVAKAALSRDSSTEVVFMTGDPSPSREKEARRLSPIAILQKPFSLQDLMECSRRALDGCHGSHE